MLIIEANYSKKLGLPHYSSHQYSLTLRAEVSDVSQVSAKSQELHALMQNCVDREIQQTGFLPNANSNSHAPTNTRTNGNGYQRQVRPTTETWKCTVNQKDLIIKITDENQLDKNRVEQLAQDRFSKGVKQLNKLEASGLIEELIQQYPSKNRRSK